MPVARDLIVHHALADKTLDEGHVEAAGRFLAAAADRSDFLRRQVQKACQSLHPLLEQLFAMHEHQRVDPALRDEPRRQHGLAEGGRRGNYAGVVGDKCRGCRALFIAQFAGEDDLQRFAADAFVADNRFDLQ